MFGQSLLSGAFSSAVPCTTDTDQLFVTDTTATTTATYQLNGVTTSIPGNNYPGTANNITYAAGKFDNAAVFNGSNADIDISLSAINTASPYTISMWFNASNAASYEGLYTGISSSPVVGQISIVKNNATTIQTFSVATNGSNTLDANTITLPTLSSGTWYNIVVIADRSLTYKSRLFINGVEGTNYTGGVASTNLLSTIKIGFADNNYFDGKIDQIRFFNSSLNQSAATVLYNETTTTAQSASIDYVGAANPNCIAYYKMSNLLDQISGNNLTNSNVNFNTEGKFGFAGKFNGSNSKLTISNSSFLPQGNNSRSISCWIKTTGGSSDGVIGYGNAVNSQAFFIYINNENKLGIFAYYNNTTGNIAISNNTWNHIVATYDGTNCRLYVNGVLDFTAAKTLNTGNGEFRIGGVNWNNSSEFFPGDIDQIRIYNSAISAANVTTLYEEIECPAATVINSFNTVVYTGNGGTQAISTVGFKPDLVWIKERNGTDRHVLIDSIRGTNSQISSNSNAAETTYSSNFTSFDSNGFTLGSASESNGNNDLFVAWNWKGSGITDTNTDGTITSQVSANKEAGFSIVKYTGNNVAGSTIGTGLSSAPEIVIIKQLDITENWVVGSDFLNGGTSPWDYVINLNNSNGESNQSWPWNDTAPSSSVITIGNGGGINTNGGTFITYAFHSIPGYQRIGNYAGSNSSQTIITNFAPGFVLIKTTSSEWWNIVDNKRNGTQTQRVFANETNAESVASNDVILTSNGFTVVGGSGSLNTSGQDFIFLAIA